MEQSLSSGSLQLRGVESHLDNKNTRQNDIWVQACYVGAKSRAQIIAKTDAAEALLPGKVAFEQMLKKFVQNPMGLQRKGHSRPRREPEQRQGVQKIRTIKHANIMEFCHIHLIKLHTLKNSAETFSSLETFSFHLSFFFFFLFLNNSGSQNVLFSTSINWEQFRNVHSQTPISGRLCQNLCGGFQQTVLLGSLGDSDAC